ncbi:MAG: Eco57I restriction-modification methylase domain-containing protein [Paludibacteraceae bacterium]|nr:Eco57I restriction-modification methylase domain-containing protein [Paludibacteraceae bacterium]
MEYTSTFKNRLIYIFRINDSAHSNCVKIGEATAPDGLAFLPNCKELNDAARNRINEYTRTAGIKYELLHTELTIYSKGGKIMSFNDKKVHEVLERSGIQRKTFDIDGKASEWFECDLETAKKAIYAVRNGQSYLDSSQKSKVKSPVQFRPEQNEAIKKTLRVFRKGNKILWNAKMRMGKTLSSLEVVKQLKFHRSIIVTHRPVVDDGWFEDFGKIFYEFDSQWIYGSKNKGESNFSKLERSGKNYVYFASMQDLRGSRRVGGNFDKNDEIFDTDWNLLIIDEAHEGTQTELGKRVFEELVKENTKVINLSGTPFNLLETNEFNEENTFTWDYVMEQRAKREWGIKHPGDHNPYEELPKLNLLTFNLGELAAKYQDYEDKAFNFAEFFRTDDDGNFIHEKDIANFLDIISSDKGETLYPFSSAGYRGFFHHTFWILPGVKEGKALAEMLRSHAIFGAYKIVNVCGTEDDETTGDPLDEVRSAIGPKPENTYTITLSCGKLTTGVTVREWTAVLYLAGSKSTSPASYMQTIFRVQSPGYIGGRMKTDCYVFDFAPDRTLKMAAAAAKISAKAGEGDKEDRLILGEFLNFCPIISCDGTEMNPYNVDQMMQQLKRVYVDKVVSTGFEDGHLYSKKLYDLSNVELNSFADLREIIGQTKANKQGNEIKINKQGFDKENIEKVKREAKKKGKELTPEQLEELAKLQAKRRQRDTAVSILRGISIRMPLLLYGARLDNEEEQITLDRFVELVDDTSWTEFMPKGVSKDKFAEFKQYYDEDIFSAAGHQIRQLARAADRMPILQRIQRIAEIFSAFRNPDKETVLTPWRVVNMHLSDTAGGWCFYDLANGTDGAHSTDVPCRVSTDPHFIDRGLVSQRLFENANVRILEINSKSGLYPLYMAYSVFRYRLRVHLEDKRGLFKNATLEDEQLVWRNVLRENIFVICKTEMARSITQRTLCGFDTTMKVNTHVYDDLLNQITNKQQEFIRRLLGGNIFPQIKNNMKFDAIVGNPPYQVMDGGAQASATPVYNRFVETAKNIEPKYISMIMPSRWMTGGKGLDDFRKAMLQDKRLEMLYDYYDAKACFQNVDIKGGICYFLWNSQYDDKCHITTIIGDERITSLRYLKDGDDLVFVRDVRIIGVKQKVIAQKNKMFDEIVSPLKPYGFRGDVFKDPSKYGFPPIDDKPQKNGFSIVGLDEKQRRVTKYLKSDFPIPRKEGIDKWKIFFTRNYGIGEIGEYPANPIVAGPNEICTETFIYIGQFDSEQLANNCLKYTKTKFFRLMVGIRKNDQGAARQVYQFVPLQDFTSKSDIDWTKSVAEIDRQLYAKYNLTDEEIAFIEKMIKPME